MNVTKSTFADRVTFLVGKVTKSLGLEAEKTKALNLISEKLGLKDRRQIYNWMSGEVAPWEKNQPEILAKLEGLMSNSHASVNNSLEGRMASLESKIDLLTKQIELLQNGYKQQGNEISLGKGKLILRIEDIEKF